MRRKLIDQEKRTTISVPVTLRDKMKEQKEYSAEPLWVVLMRILNGGSEGGG